MIVCVHVLLEKHDGAHFQEVVDFGFVGFVTMLSFCRVPRPFLLPPHLGKLGPNPQNATAFRLVSCKLHRSPTAFSAWPNPTRHEKALRGAPGHGALVLQWR